MTTELQTASERLDTLRAAVDVQAAKVRSLASNEQERGDALRNIPDAELQAGAVSIDLDAQIAILEELERRCNAQTRRVRELRRAAAVERLQPGIERYEAAAAVTLRAAGELLAQLEDLQELRGQLDAEANAAGLTSLDIKPPSLGKIATAIRASQIAWDVHTGRRWSVTSTEAPRFLVQTFDANGKRQLVDPATLGREAGRLQKLFARRWSGETSEV